jgi:hypothetical protein
MQGNHIPNQARFIPQRLFVNQLTSGLFELSTFFVFDLEDVGETEQIAWEVISTNRDYRLRVLSPFPTPNEDGSHSLPIAAVLPSLWDHGVLEVEGIAGGTRFFHSLVIEQYFQRMSCILPLSGHALTVAGHRLGEAHRLATQIPSQQFGWDFLGLGGDALSILHLQKNVRAADFPGFGMDVVAPADGYVYEARDGRHDLEGIGHLPQDIACYQEDLTRALGNYVIIKHDEQVWSVLAHLQRDSLRVRTGQRVTMGEVLAALGNSGFSSGPHLHFHVMDGPDLLHAAPLPVRLSLEDGVFSPQAGDIVSNAYDTLS